MDRSRPLWELYIIEGLKTGQVALYSKMHHAGIDGQAGVALAKVLYSDIGRSRPPVKPPRAPRARQRATSSAWPNWPARRCATRRARRRHLMKSLPKTAKSVLDMLAPVSEDDGKRRLGKLSAPAARAAHAAERVDLQPARLCRALGAAGRDQGT